ncbi:MAG: hypothetical protein RMZ41_017105 [Nostoc sp. DedVER02]|uniref:hypothetical protein n=1 Tax=unclassified Nostoc TaxID=2593658 RepID=UPI002AD35FB2|nr:MULTISPECIES: hypothetical protein [unclassified Nostoc]MDZ7986220.1 hypothetical protein [Nostoc sp. DedVER02]MDZ8113772.1 hypothetical protein [Nostoc sp. DedVER01b]
MLAPTNLFTCLVEIIGNIPPPETDEQEMLETLAPNNLHARLDCQINVTGNVEIRGV